VLTVKPEVLEREKLNNVSIQVDKVERKPESLPTQVQAMEKMLRSLHREGGKEPRVDFAQLYVRMEQLPNRESRVVLDDSRDALGQSRSKLIWKLSEHEHRTGHRIMQLLAGELGSREAGRVISSEGDAPWLRLEVSSHHLGTTRMDPDSTRGVVDTNCTVHGVDNLHVAGSSVFPSGGFANPTFTIVALALRLSDRLKGLLK
jgi:choline dehydrogenase-like flavoprotein